MLGLYAEHTRLADEELPTIPARTVAGLRTHDMEPFAMLYEGGDLAGYRTKLQRAIGRRVGTSRAALLEGALTRIASSDAYLVVADLDDLLGETTPHNIPGKVAADDLAAPPATADVGDARRPGGTASPGDPDEARRAMTSGPPGELDLHLFNEGTHRRIHNFLGAHPDDNGCWFAVWAPNARAVDVVGDFTGWKNPIALEPVAQLGGVVRPRPRTPRSATAIGSASRTSMGVRDERSDPVAAATFEPPSTASRIADLSYDWGDSEWMADRGAAITPEAPISIYEVHLGSWGRVATPGRRWPAYEELADPLADHVLSHGFTHVELLPVMEHPFYGSWGYQVTGYFAPTARYGDPIDLDADDRPPPRTWRRRAARLGAVALPDGRARPVSASTARTSTSTLTRARASTRTGSRRSSTTGARRFARSWCRARSVGSSATTPTVCASTPWPRCSTSTTHASEGQWVPNRYGGRENLAAIDFVKQCNTAIAEEFPDTTTMAEESTAWPHVTGAVANGGLGFGFKWDMGWMHDVLQYQGREPVHRRFHHDEITFRSMYAFSERYVLPLSHDEVVHGKGSLLRKMPGDEWQRFANLRLLYGTMWGQPGKKLLFMGGELATLAEWAHEGMIDWALHDEPDHEGVRRLVADLNAVYQREAALHRGDCEPAGFRFVVGDDDTHSVFAWLRLDPRGEAPAVLVVANATPAVHYGYRIGVPDAGEWTEILNTDATVYGGSGVGNLGLVVTEDQQWHGFPQSLALTLPPLSVVYLREHILKPRRLWSPALRCERPSASEGAATERPAWPGNRNERQSKEKLDMWTGRKRWATELAAHATAPATSGTATRRPARASHGIWNGSSTARVTANAGISPVGIARAIPVSVITSAFDPASDRIVRGRAPTATSTSRSSRLSVAASASPIATTSSVSTSTTPMAIPWIAAQRYRAPVRPRRVPTIRKIGRPCRRRRGTTPPARFPRTSCSRHRAGPASTACRCARWRRTRRCRSRAGVPSPR